MYSIIILCGGRGRRMGQDKGLMLLQDKPLIFHVLETAFKVADEIIIVLRDKKQTEEYGKIIEKSDINLENIILCTDIIKEQGPLAGIYTGLMNVSSNFALVVPCDSPFISRTFMEKILSYSRENIDAIVPKWSDGRVEPLHAVYNKDITSLIKARLEEGKRDVKSLLKILNVKYLSSEYLDKSGRSLLNLNRPEDFNNSPKF